MLTYQLQERILESDGKVLRFPNAVDIRCVLSPVVPFGGTSGPSKNAVADRELAARFNRHTGRAYVLHKTPLFDEVSVDVQLGQSKFRVKGPEVQIEDHCQSLQDLQDLISAVYYVLPAILCAHLPDPIEVGPISGSVGDVKFRWIYEPSRLISSMVITSKAHQENILSTSWGYLGRAGPTSSRRLTAGLIYYYQAIRLLNCGRNYFEFLSEAILNLSRCLQALFGESRDEVRAGLTSLDKYSHTEIEAWFISAMVLRSEFDVAHVSLSALSRNQLKVLLDYCEGAENHFRDLMKAILEATASSAPSLPNDPNLQLGKDKIAILKQIRENLHNARRERAS